MQIPKPLLSAVVLGAVAAQAASGTSPDHNVSGDSSSVANREVDHSASSNSPIVMDCETDEPKPLECNPNKNRHRRKGSGGCVDEYYARQYTKPLTSEEVRSKQYREEAEERKRALKERYREFDRRNRQKEWAFMEMQEQKRIEDETKKRIRLEELEVTLRIEEEERQKVLWNRNHDQEGNEIEPAISLRAAMKPYVDIWYETAKHLVKVIEKLNPEVHDPEVSFNAQRLANLLPGNIILRVKQFIWTLFWTDEMMKQYVWNHKEMLVVGVDSFYAQLNEKLETIDLVETWGSLSEKLTTAGQLIEDLYCMARSPPCLNIYHGVKGEMRLLSSVFETPLLTDDVRSVRDQVQRFEPSGHPPVLGNLQG